MHIDRLFQYPLTGAKGVDSWSADIDEFGLDYDRHLVMYDPETMKRLSTKAGQLPRLMKVTALYTPGADGAPGSTSIEGIPRYGTSHESRRVTDEPGGEIVTINEFKTDVGVIDLGDDMAEFMYRLVGENKYSSVRLAMRTDRLGLSDPAAPEERGNKPLHILSTSTIDSISNRTGLESDDVVRRLRPNIVIDTSSYEAHNEQDWRLIRIGDVVIQLIKSTVRCDVPGRDPKTALSDKIIPKYYEEMPKAMVDGRSRSVIGVYGFLSTEPTTLNRGDAVEVEV